MNPTEKTVQTSDGKIYRYKQLLTTIPLDITLTWLGKEELAKKLTYSSSHIIGIGIRGTNPHGNKCWLYYPEDNCPYYRCTVFSHYAKKNCPSDDTKLATKQHGDKSIHVLDK